MNTCKNCDKKYTLVKIKLARLYTKNYCSEACRQIAANKKANGIFRPPADGNEKIKIAWIESNRRK